MALCATGPIRRQALIMMALSTRKLAVLNIAGIGRLLFALYFISNGRRLSSR